MLLNYLISRATIPEYQVRWSWQPGDVVVWDNRSTQHYAVERLLARARARWSAPASWATSRTESLAVHLRATPRHFRIAPSETAAS